MGVKLGQLAVAALIIEAIAHDENVGDFESAILHVHAGDAPVRPIQQRANFERRRLTRVKRSRNVL
jgi:hypothetical protein